MFELKDFENLHNKVLENNYKLTKDEVIGLMDTVKYLAKLVKTTDEKFKVSLRSELVGYCKECGSKIGEKDSLKDAGYANIYQCPCCSHPHTKNEMWSSIPYYIKEKL
jgi:hypothetical protein